MTFILFFTFAFPYIDPNWPPKFESTHLINQTLQGAMEQHPPMKDWFLKYTDRNEAVGISSVEELVHTYKENTKYALFITDLAIIALDTKLNKVRGLDWGLIKRYSRYENGHSSSLTEMIVKDQVTREWNKYTADPEVLNTLLLNPNASSGVTTLEAYVLALEKEIVKFKERRNNMDSTGGVDVKVVPVVAGADAVAASVAIG